MRSLYTFGLYNQFGLNQQRGKNMDRRTYQRRNIRWMIMLCLTLSLAPAGLGFAQTKTTVPTGAPPNAATQTTAPSDPELTQPLVTRVACNKCEDPNKIELEQELVVKVVNARPLWNESAQKDKRIVLFIDGIPLPGIEGAPRQVEKDGSAEIQFFIPLSDETTNMWSHLVQTRKRGELFTTKAAISIDLEGHTVPIATNIRGENGFTFVLAVPRWFYFCLFSVLAITIIFIDLAIKSDVIRDAGPQPAGGGRKPYSLARTQMAVWFITILAAWLYLYVFKHTFNTITDSLIALMGISAGTGVGSVAIENNQNISSPRTQGFINDLISDQNGVSFHRFQIFAWTIALVVVFIRHTITYLAMPVFGTSLLILMGISSGTYIGFKFAEKPVASPNVPAGKTDTPAGTDQSS